MKTAKASELIQHGYPSSDSSDRCRLVEVLQGEKKKREVELKALSSSAKSAQFEIVEKVTVKIDIVP